MWRPAHGATTGPGPCRPTNGYGRALGRPGPRADDRVFDDLLGDERSISALDPSLFEQEVEVAAPVTP